MKAKAHKISKVHVGAGEIHSPAHLVSAIWLRYGWALAALVAMAIYLPTVHYNYTFDDVAIVQENPRIRHLGDWRAYLATSWWDWKGLDREYRPLTMASFALGVALAGNGPAAAHAINIILHGLVCALLWLLVWRLFGRRDLALACALLFAVHPVHVEAVTGIVGRAELLMTAFFLLALLAAHASCRARDWRGRLGWALAAFPAALAALFAKEHAVMLAPAMALLTLVPDARPDRSRQCFKDALRPLLPAIGAALLATVAYMLTRRVVLGAFLVPTGAPVQALSNPLMQLHGAARLCGAIEVLAFYALALVAPFNPSPDYSARVIPLVRDAADPLWLPGLLVLLAILAGIAWLRRRPAPLFGLLFLVVTFFVASNLLLTIGTIMAERLLYLPSVGFCLLLAALALELRQPARRRAVMVLGLFGAALLVQHFRYLPAWRDNDALFAYSMRRAPNSSRVQAAYGWALAGKGDNRDALQHLLRALEIAPNNYDAMGRAGIVYYRLGDTDNALGFLSRVVGMNQSIDLFSSNLARVYEARGQREQAELVLRRSLGAQPDSHANHLELGLLLADEGRWSEALGELQIAQPNLEPADRERFSQAMTRIQAALKPKNDRPIDKSLN